MSPSPSEHQLEADLAKEERLRALLSALEGQAVALAFSGGVDSSYLLAVAREALGQGQPRALLAVSPALSQHQRNQAHAVARFLGAEVEEIRTDELLRPEYRANRGDRCFFCKDTLFATFEGQLEAGTILLEGTNAGDLDGHRPGHRAGQDHGVRSPLVEAELDKAAIRRLSRLRKLPTAELPASPCLASRIPAGIQVDAAALGRVEEAEDTLRDLGFREFRVRHHDSLARLEIAGEERNKLDDPRLLAELNTRLKAAGYRFVTLDLEGFRSGSSSTPDGSST